MSLILKQLKKYRIILASASPRRQLILKQLGLDFDIIVRETNEEYPSPLLFIMMSYMMMI